MSNACRNPDRSLRRNEIPPLLRFDGELAFEGIHQLMPGMFVPGECYWPVHIDKQLRDLLDQNNISERSLFPGLPGLCAWLKRYYGAAW